MRKIDLIDVNIIKTDSLNEALNYLKSEKQNSTYIKLSLIRLQKNVQDLNTYD